MSDLSDQEAVPLLMHLNVETWELLAQLRGVDHKGLSEIATSRASVRAAGPRMVIGVKP